MEANFNTDVSYDATSPIGDFASGLSPEEKRQQDEALMRELEEVCDVSLSRSLAPLKSCLMPNY